MYGFKVNYPISKQDLSTILIINIGIYSRLFYERIKVTREI